jgi:hypothetical protein
MNTLLLAGLLLLSGLGAQGQASPSWPHNPKTGEVEMQGMLPWQDSAKTELQRRRLVQHWYLTKLAALLAHTATKQHERAFLWGAAMGLP